MQPFQNLEFASGSPQKPSPGFPLNEWWGVGNHILQSLKLFTGSIGFLNSYYPLLYSNLTVILIQ
jgi:hypothetical protein